MSSKRRHIGRRVAGVVTGVALLLLGLEAPASAAVTTITAITPGSGPDNCVTVVTGTGFTDFPEDQMDVDFINAGDASSPNAADFLVIDATTIWSVVPAGTDPGVSYTVRVTNPANAPTGVTSTATFVNTAAAGACAPTITSFTPCASPGDVVVITGTNLISANLSGATVFFSPYDTALPPAVEATHTVPDVDDVTSLSVIVPSTTSGANSGTVDGPIKVITDVGSAFSATSFLVPPPDCAPVTGNEHARSITFKLKKSGAASGVVSSTEDPAFTDCVASVPVKIQRKTKSGWKNAGSTTTTDTGSYTKQTKGKPGKYRALAPAMSLGDPVTDKCLKAKSATRTIK
jgi:hypothetical protein